MLKSIEQISFNSKREVETEIRKGLWVRGEETEEVVGGD